jgi:hypothetical protein
LADDCTFQVAHFKVPYLCCCPCARSSLSSGLKRAPALPDSSDQGSPAGVGVGVGGFPAAGTATTGQSCMVALPSDHLGYMTPPDHDPPQQIQDSSGQVSLRVLWHYMCLQYAPHAPFPCLLSTVSAFSMSTQQTQNGGTKTCHSLQRLVCNGKAVFDAMLPHTTLLHRLQVLTSSLSKELAGSRPLRKARGSVTFCGVESRQQEMVG